jgi:transcriptional regulator with PAS, ATPase and Fis domain
MKILLSWYATKHDFSHGKVVETGPTADFHRCFFNHDKHMILSAASEDDTAHTTLINWLCRQYPGRKIEGQLMGVDNIISVEAIKVKIEPLLLSLAEHEVDVFVSPGTPAMQVVWYLCQQTLGGTLRLFQTVGGHQTKTGKPEIIEASVQVSTVPVSAIIKSGQLGRQDSRAGSFLLTESIRPVYERAYKVAQTDTITCLIQGASGTGKEHLARYIHEQSARRNGTFIAVNCASLSDTLLESRLFGHKKGAFTGATENAIGYFEAAKGGTLFLDEIGDISPVMQQTLLRVLQEQEITRVGETSSRKVDVRVVAATHQNLREQCRDGSFRWDLLYRLSVTELYLPSVTERGLAEKKALIDHFLNRKRKLFGRPKQLTIEANAAVVLEAYSFPGNVRELENLVESLYVFCDDVVTKADLPGWLAAEVDNNLTATFQVEAHERRLIEQALRHFKGNKSKAQRALGYGSVNTLNRKISEYGIG